MRLGLESMRAACAHFGHPERAFPAVHIAGTNGKGSVSAMVEAIARVGRGAKTGLYTSPHLCRFAERIQVGGTPLDDAALAALLTDVLRRAPDLSFFEAATLAAFVAFREANVDVAVLEVGIGGRLDATNVIPPPRAAAITRIAFDHTDKLGDTLVAIAREKAGIAKPGVPIALGAVPDEVHRAIEEVANAAGARIVRADTDPAARALVDRSALALHGAHQRENAKVACVVARLAFGAHSGAGGHAVEPAILDGLARVRWPGRLERIAARGTSFLLDAAHNPDGAEALAHELARASEPEVAQIAPTARPGARTLVFGALEEKPWPEMLDRLAPLFAHRLYFAPRVGGGRAATPPALLAARHTGHAFPTEAALDAVLDEAAALAGATGEVVVTGSIFLVGSARALLLNLPVDPPVAL
jgi:dihydrofolate synthase/folylpolyglutamate synthase